MITTNTEYNLPGSVFDRLGNFNVTRTVSIEPDEMSDPVLPGFFLNKY